MFALWHGGTEARARARGVLGLVEALDTHVSSALGVWRGESVEMEKEATRGSGEQVLRVVAVELEYHLSDLPGEALDVCGACVVGRVGWVWLGAEELEDLAFALESMLEVCLEQLSPLLYDRAVGWIEEVFASVWLWRSDRLEDFGAAVETAQVGAEVFKHGRALAEHMVAGEKHLLLEEEEADVVGGMAWGVHDLEGGCGLGALATDAHCAAVVEGPEGHGLGCVVGCE